MEIEREFLLTELPELNELSKMEIEQFYIMFDPEIRARRLDNNYFLTIKSKNTLVREEFEVGISKTMYDSLKLKTITNILIKDRYKINDIIVDIFHQPFKFNMAEVEFESVEEANNFSPPKWFGRETTEDDQFHNENYKILINKMEVNNNDI